MQTITAPTPESNLTNPQLKVVNYREELAGLAFKAIEVLRTILHNEDASPSVRLRAAQAVLKLAATQPEATETVQKTSKPHNPAQQQPIRRTIEPGRNSQCPCGSGLKYKRCCANKLVPALSTAAA
jgi:uncharacterized protein YecA (UPF0149 family)